MITVSVPPLKWTEFWLVCEIRCICRSYYIWLYCEWISDLSDIGSLFWKHFLVFDGEMIPIKLLHVKCALLIECKIILQWLLLFALAINMAVAPVKPRTAFICFIFVIIIKSFLQLLVIVIVVVVWILLFRLVTSTTAINLLFLIVAIISVTTIAIVYAII